MIKPDVHENDATLAAESTGAPQHSHQRATPGPGRLAAMNRHRTRQTLVVDGERFDVTQRPEQPGTYDFTWLTGPNPGYGFTSAASPARALSIPELEASARNFLEQVDPTTGHIE